MGVELGRLCMLAGGGCGGWYMATAHGRSWRCMSSLPAGILMQEPRHWPVGDH